LSTGSTHASDLATGRASRGFTGWIAPPERDQGKAAMEKSLWEEADQFRANSGLKAQEYYGPILGLIFLRFADARVMPRWQQLKDAAGSERRGSREEDPNAHLAGGADHRDRGTVRGNDVTPFIGPG
jgi:hypothetical protein